MKDAFEEMAEFAGRACGIIAIDLAELSPSAAEAFRRGWQQVKAGAPRPDAGASPASDVF